ncbi:MAG: Ig-like domain-containing protein [Ignavibacteria bacterium]|nr:Ig-like domain-containing protein [Ignavibacteria bacterium]
MFQKLIISSTVLTVCLLSIFLIRCANQLPPTGGDVDRIPPEIEEVYPPNGTTNYDEDYFEIEFSEYVDKRSVQDAIFISPYIDGALDFDWTGTTVEITFPNELRKDITFTVTVGTDVVDRNNKNRMLQSYSFSFATGEKIDRKMISGKIFGKEKEGIYLFAYKLAAASADTVLNNKPDYVSQSGANGKYNLSGLASGTYRVFAVNDKYKDLLYQQDQDEIGMPYKDVVLTDIDSVFSNLNFLLLNADTTKPRVINSVVTDNYHLLVTFNKELDYTKLSSSNFSLFDSTENRYSEIKYLYKGRAKPKDVVLVFDERFNDDNQVFLFADSLIDKSGNITQKDFTKLVLSDRPDTTSIRVISTKPTQNGNIDFINTRIKIFFDDAFVKNEIFSAITFTDTLNNSVPFEVDFYDDATLLILPLKELKAEKDYRIKINLSRLIDAAGNTTDSVFALNFETISGLDFTGISGVLVSQDTTEIDFKLNSSIVLENSENEYLVYKKNLKKEVFDFSRVEPGKYVLWCYFDEDKSGEYYYGYPFPFEYSEKFFFYQDTLNLRPRWEITDLKFYLK